MYKIFNSEFDGKPAMVLRITDNTYIPFSPDNTDYQAYLKWLEESPDNLPLPAENT